MLGVFIHCTLEHSFVLCRYVEILYLISLNVQISGKDISFFLPGLVGAVTGGGVWTVGEVAMTGDVALSRGEVALTGGEVALSCGEVTLTGGEVALSCGEVAMTGGEVALCGVEDGRTSGEKLD